MSYRVEWCPYLPADGHGGVDVDLVEYVTKIFALEASALQYARTILPRDAWGSVAVTPVEYDREIHAWKRNGETTFVES